MTATRGGIFIVNEGEITVLLRDMTSRCFCPVNTLGLQTTSRNPTFSAEQPRGAAQRAVKIASLLALSLFSHRFQEWGCVCSFVHLSCFVNQRCTAIMT